MIDVCDKFNESWHSYRIAGGLCAVIFLYVLATTSYGNQGQEQEGQLEVVQSSIVQQTCPVKTENEIDPGIYTEYEGEKVYYCCNFCLATFRKEPGKYLNNLQQFGEISPGDNQQEEVTGGPYGQNDEQSSERPLIKLVKPVGIVTVCLVVLIVLIWVFRLKKLKVD